MFVGWPGPDPPAGWFRLPGLDHEASAQRLQVQYTPACARCQLAVGVPGHCQDGQRRQAIVREEVRESILCSLSVASGVLLALGFPVGDMG